MGEKSSNMEYNDVIMYQKLVKTCSEIAKLRRVSEKTAIKLNDGTTFEENIGSVAITPQSDAQILVLRVQNKDAYEWRYLF